MNKWIVLLFSQLVFIQHALASQAEAQTSGADDPVESIVSIFDIFSIKESILEKIIIVFAGLLAAKLVIPLIIHIASSLLKKKHTLTMIQLDVKSRTDHAIAAKEGLKIKLTEFVEGGREPFVVSVGDSHEVFEIKKDKWHIPSFAFKKVYAFYSASSDATGFIDRIHTQDFKDAMPEVKIAIYHALLECFEDTAKKGAEVLDMIQTKKDRRVIRNLFLAIILISVSLEFIP